MQIARRANSLGWGVYAAAYVNAGSLELEQGRPADARRHFAIALTLDGSNEAARQGLGAAHARLTRP